MRKSLARLIGATAEIFGSLLGLALRIMPGLLAVGLVAYGAWLAWPPAGFITAGLLLLIDRVWTQVRVDRRPTQ